jgi:DNA polymerase III delta subunit
VLAGEEDYLINHYRGMMREAYGGKESLNYVCVAYSGPDNTSEVFDAVSAPSMLGGEDKLVEVMVTEPGIITSTTAEEFVKVLKEAGRYPGCSILVAMRADVFDCGSPPRRPSAAFTKISGAEGIYFLYLPRQGGAALRKWIMRRFGSHGVVCGDDVAQYMIDVCGNFMTMLAREIDKASYYAISHKIKNINRGVIDLVCCPYAEPDAFGLSNAILSGRTSEALDALRAEVMRRTEPLMLLASITRVFVDLLAVRVLLDEGSSPREVASQLKMNEYKASLYIKSAATRSRTSIENALIHCADADMLIKLSTVPPYTAIERLICSADAGVRS